MQPVLVITVTWCATSAIVLAISAAGERATSLPVAECGSDRPNSTLTGTLNLASRSAQCSTTCFLGQLRVRPRHQHGLHRLAGPLAGTPTTAASATAGSSSRTRSTSCG